MSRVIGATVGTPFNPEIIKKETLNAISADIAGMDKRITNLEQSRSSELFETDSSVAHVKAVPSRALPYAEVGKIGGMTRKCANILPAKDTDSFITTADGANNYLTLYSNFYLESGSVTISFNITQGGTSNNRNTPRLVSVYGSDYGELVFAVEESKLKAGRYSYDGTITQSVLYKLQWWDANNTVPQTISRIMLNYGDTALPFEAYYDGLRSAKATELMSHGANMLDYTKASATTTHKGVTFTNNGDGSFTIDGEHNNSDTLPATCYIHNISEGNILPLKKGVTYTISGNALNKVGVCVYDEKWKTYAAQSSNSASFTIEDDNLRYGFYLFVNSNTKIENVTVYPMLNIGEDAAPFKPYKETVDTFSIPEEIQALDGYGDGINESCYNYIDYEKKQFIKRVGKVDMGTLDWVVDLGSCLYSANLNCKYLGNVLCVGYETVFDDSLLLSGTWDIICAGNGYIGLTNTSNDEAETFKSAMSGNMLYYELAEPIVTDISDLISEDSFIEVEGGGAITAVNESNSAVPSEISYMLKEETV